MNFFFIEIVTDMEFQTTKYVQIDILYCLCNAFLNRYDAECIQALYDIISCSTYQRKKLQN